MRLLTDFFPKSLFSLKLFVNYLLAELCLPSLDGVVGVGVGGESFNAIKQIKGSAFEFSIPCLGLLVYSRFNSIFCITSLQYVHRQESPGPAAYLTFPMDFRIILSSS